MNAKEERAYIEGGRSAWRRLLGDAILELSWDKDSINSSADQTVARGAAAIVQLDEVRAEIRKLCEKFGDDSWEDGDHLVDVLRNYLEPHLTKKRK